MEVKHITGGILTVCLFLGYASCESPVSTLSLKRTFDSINLATARDPLTYQGRKHVQDFLNLRLSGIVATLSSSPHSGGQERNYVHRQTFQTALYPGPSSKVERPFDATNYIVVFSSQNETEDEPLLFLANYDTDESEANPVNDNGSGLVALYSLIETIAQKIGQGKLELRNSLVFVASDAALLKSAGGLPSTGTTGAEAFVRVWLPRFMENRRKFGGAVVLDSLMNYHDEPESQEASTFRKAFPLAHREIERQGLRGNFLGLVGRQGMDDVLSRVFDKAWNFARVEAKSHYHEDPEAGNVNPHLVKFQFTNSSHLAGSQGAMNFLRSEQVPFWNEFLEKVGRPSLRTKRLPAILLTDTGKFRRTDCLDSGCSLEKVTTPKNVEFLRRTVNSLYNLAVLWQEDELVRNSSNPTQYSLLTVILPLIASSIVAMFNSH